MKNLLIAFINLISKITGKKNLERILVFCAKSINTNLHMHGLLQIGAGTGVYLENGSELFFIKNILSNQLCSEKQPILFDIGANIGHYSLMLKFNITNATIYSFEPVEEAFLELEKNLGSKSKTYNIGFGASTGKQVLYNTTISEITTSHKEVLSDIFDITDFKTIEFEVDTIDNFCTSNNIKIIDFLKIDVEGNEFFILQGASNMLTNKNIKFIQFEFNTHNVYSRIYLRDFYLLLKDFDFYRLNQNSLVFLGDYNPANEIFTAQNIVAVRKDLSTAIDEKYVWRA